MLTFVDVTPVARAEERLRESEARLRTIVEGIPQLVWRSDEGGRWTWSSPQWTAFTGQAAAAAVEHGWLEKVHPDDRRHVLETWSKAAGTGTLELHHRVWCQADDGWRSMHTRAVPVYDDEAGEWLGTSTDVNEIPPAAAEAEDPAGRAAAPGSQHARGDQVAGAPDGHAKP